MYKNKILLLEQHTSRGEDFTELQAILEKAGVSMTVERRDDRPYDVLIFSYEDEVVLRKQNRDAGRKSRIIYSNKTLSMVTVGEVKEMLKTRTQDDVAEEFNISRSTLIRRLRQHDDLYL